MNIKNKVKVALQVLVTAAALAVVASYVINAYIIDSTSARIFAPEKLPQSSYDCILVLGCGVRADGTPSDMLKDRLETGIDLYKSGIAPKIIMSGDHGRKDYDEVNKMKAYAEEKGVPSEDIFMDHAGFSTYESIYRAREIFKVSKTVIVTQNFHTCRALHIADKLGVKAAAVSADRHKYRGIKYIELREYAARNKDFWTCILKPKPKFLGEAIPVSGSGNATNDLPES